MGLFDLITRKKLVRGDVGLTEDLLFALKNIYAIEEHSLGSFNMNKEKKWLELNEIARNMRQKWIQVIIKKENSQIYCITKHLLGAILGLQEVANRLYSQKKFKESEEADNDAKILIGLLFVLNELN